MNAGQKRQPAGAAGLHISTVSGPCNQLDDLRVAQQHNKEFKYGIDVIILV